MKLWIMTSFALMAMITTSKNPVKMSMTLVFMSFLSFFLLYYKSGMSWFPMIYTLLFTGGILVMFMILSSFHPNSTSGKIDLKIPTIVFLMSTISLYFFYQYKTENSIETSMKVFMSEWQTSITTLLIMMTYFLVFLIILKKESTGMRMVL